MSVGWLCAGEENVGDIGEADADDRMAETEP